MPGPTRAARKQVELPLVPLRELVVFPSLVTAIHVGRPSSVEALEKALEGDRELVVTGQKDSSQDDPEPQDLHAMGTVVRVHQVARLPDGILKAMVEGLFRARILEYPDVRGIHRVVVDELEEAATSSLKVQALMRNVHSLFEAATKVVPGKKLSPEAAPLIAGLDSPGRLADIVIAHLEVPASTKQGVLAAVDPEERLEIVSEVLQREIEVAHVEKRIRGRVKKQMETLQKEYFLREQVKAIQKELGEGDDLLAEIAEYQRRIEASGMPRKVGEQCEQELSRLSKVSNFSAEATVIRNWLDTVIELPWTVLSEDRLDIEHAREILEQDHFGLEEPKERILEYLSVLKLKKKLKGPILCLVGPPGVGKTSIAMSVAKAMGREFVRMSLGGMHDEAEIRGHRKTYVGAMPGRIIQNIKKAGTSNPVFLLDEIDKTGRDWRGDPTSALLEVLDPEQNAAFQDHYLAVPFDLSNVLFIATANLPHLIPGPLRDRMEEISLPGYTVEDKLAIAEKYLVKKQVEENGLGSVSFRKDALLRIITSYTREAGVRSLERAIAKVLRKEARTIAEKLEADVEAASGGETGSGSGKKAKGKAAARKKKAVKSVEKAVKDLPPVAVDVAMVIEHLGPEKFRPDRVGEDDRVGVVQGLAWTATGGTLLPLEVEALPGTGKLMITGSLGEVMQESVQAAVTYVRVHHGELALDAEFHKNFDLHVHAPEGATPKDGPSAGVTITTAVVSALTGRAVSARVAMTGEVTLLGKVLEVGGIKEKLLAAHRAGIQKVLIPEPNVKDLEKIPAEVTKAMEIIPVKHVGQVLEHALLGK